MLPRVVAVSYLVVSLSLVDVCYYLSLRGVVRCCFFLLVVVGVCGLRFVVVFWFCGRLCCCCVCLFVIAFVGVAVCHWCCCV